MNTLDELTAYIENLFPCVEGLPTPICQTGDSYVVIGEEAGDVGPRIIAPMVPGVVREGRVRKWHSGVPRALIAATACFDLYAEGRFGTLYWRRPAYWSRYGKRCAVYLRLAISDKPIIYPDMETLDIARGGKGQMAA